MPRSFPDHFSRIAGNYATYRPGYPDELFAWLATLPSRHDLAWDCGTGSGQAAIGLTPSFSRIVATDASAAQIVAATLHPRIEYHVAPAEASGLTTSSVDLVTVAQALHWFNLEPFYAEVTRVLAPGGVLAVWTYGIVRSDDLPVDEVLQTFYANIGRWWPPNRRLVETGFRTVPFPFREVSPVPFEMTALWNLGQLLGYVSTWSAVTRCREATGHDAVSELSGALTPLWSEAGTTKVIRWPLSVRAGRGEKS